VSPDNDEYRKALAAAGKELETLSAQRAELDRRIGQLMQTVGNLMRLCNLTPTVAIGLTDGIRMVLRSAGSPLTAVEVRAQLAAMGVDLSRYENDLAAIHTTLKRLDEGGEVRFVPQPWGKPAYQWVPGALPKPRTLEDARREAEALGHPPRKKASRRLRAGK
jgi:hypothetical protein